MSYRYGLNGNDLNWDVLEGWSMKCCNCEPCKDPEEEYFCDGHTIKYTKKGVPGAVYHDTNDNFVSITGKIPLSVYCDDYLIEWLNDPTNGSRRRSALREELRDRGYIITVPSGRKALEKQVIEQM